MIGYGLKSLNKWSNIALFLAVLLAIFFIKERIQFSTDLFAFLPEGKHKSIAQNYWSSTPGKELFIAVEGMDTKALSKIKDIEKKALDSGFFALQIKADKNPHLASYLQDYRYFTQDFTPKEIDVNKALKKLANEISQSVLYAPIDTKDPFGLFSSPLNPAKPSLNSAHMRLGDIGYISILKTKEKIDEQKAYNFLMQLEEEDVHLFSPLFYFIENPKNIQNSVNLLLGITIVLLSLIYIVVLRNLSLLLNTITTLATSILVALGVVWIVWTEVSIFVLAFGVAVSSLGVDYMFHHYFHHHYSDKRAFNRSVFWGFATTVSLFVLFMSIDFLLVKQFSLFALVCLVVAYVHFAFLYPKIGFMAPPEKAIFKWKRFGLKHKFIVIGSLVCLGFAWPWIQVDTSVRSLDYQNEKRLKEENFFKANLQKNEYSPIILEARDMNELVFKSRKVRQTFPRVQLPLSDFLDKESFDKRCEKLSQLYGYNEKIEFLAKKQGFKEGYFKDAYSEKYLNKDFFLPSIEQFHEMGIDIFKISDGYATKGYIPNIYTQSLESWDGIYIMEANSLFFKAMKDVLDEVLWIGMMGVVLLVVMLWISCQQRFLYALSYILFPVAFVVVFFTQMAFSIMHLFMLFVFLALSVDYGIYVARATEVSQTRTAIVFSLLSTCAGFGVLAFSNVGALQDLGAIVILGSFAVGALLLLREKDEYHCSG